MKTFKSYIILLSALLVSIASCSRTEDPTNEEIAADPTFISLTFAANDSIPDLKSTKFELTGDSSGSIVKWGIITNVDSLPYQSKLEKLLPIFYFKSSSSTYAYVYADAYTNDTINLYETDTIDFTHPVRILNTSSDRTAQARYEVVVNVHQIEPELYVWKKLSNNITENIGSEQKALLFGNKYLYFLSNGLNNYLYSASTPSSNWSNETLNFVQAPTSEIRFRYMTDYNNTLYVTTNTNELYASTDGATWNKKNYTIDNGAKIYNLLFSLNNNLWAIAQLNDEYFFVSTTDGTAWTKKASLPDNFPVGNFASLVFKSRLGNPKAIVLGGNDKTGELKKANWSTENGEYWVNLGQEDKTLGAVAGATLVQYDDKLLMFGGMDSDNMVVENYYRESTDQGLSWSVPDTTYNKLPDDYAPRSFQSAIVDENDKRIYLIGGKDNITTYSDVWTGKLNRMFFD